MPQKTDITAMAELLNNDAKLKDIGSRLVAAAIERAYESRLGIPPQSAQIERVWREGTPIPEDLKGIVDPGTKAWREGWNDFIIWKDKWGDDKGMPVPSLETAAGRLRRMVDLLAESKFSADEIQVLKDLKIMPQ